jgi:hypothetical protein
VLPGGSDRTAWRARIRNNKGLCGFGVVVSPRQVLTCAHILVDPGTDPTDQAACPAETTFSVDLVGLPRTVRARAVAEAWVPPTPDNQGDVALLELDQAAPDYCVAAMRWLPASWPDDDLRAKAYGPSPYADVWINVTIVGWAGGGGEWVQLGQEKPGPGIAPGFSGTGVCVARGGRAYVVGVVVGVAMGRRDGPDPGVSWMVPMDMVVRHLPGLRDLVKALPREDPLVVLIRGLRAGRVRIRIVLAVTGDSDSPASAALSSGSAPRSGLADAQPSGADPVWVDASGRTAREVGAQFVDALGARADGALELSDHGSSVSRMRVIVADIDEASDPDAVMTQVITPLVRGRAQVVAGFRREVPPSAIALAVDALASRVDEVREAEQAAHERYWWVAARVAGVPTVPRHATELRVRLAEIRAATAGGQEVVTALTTTVLDAERAHHAIRHVMERLDEARDHLAHLRGRLEAYRAMAAQGGLVEDIDLSELYGAAREPLWGGRCDLAAADEAVARYIRAVHEKLRDRGVG